MTVWKSVRLSALLQEVDDRGHPDLVVLSVYRDLGVVPKASREDNFNKTPEDLTSYKRVRIGDLVVNKMKAWSGSLAISSFGGIVSGDYMVCAVTGPVDRRFLHHLLRSAAVFGLIAARSTGIRPNQWRLYWDDLRDIRVDIPEPRAQREIAKSLDAEMARLDRLVAALERLRDVCEQRAANGAAFAFDGPPVRVKYLVSKIGSGKTPLGGSESYLDNGVTLIRSTNVRAGFLDLSDVAHIDDAADELMASTRLKPNDVLLNITGASIGRSAIVPCDFGPANVNQHVCILRPTPSTRSSLLSAALLTPQVQQQINALQVGGNREGLTFDQVGNLEVRWPGVDRVGAAVARVGAEFEWGSRMRHAIDSEIALLGERRRAFITAAVTGQFEIPGVAA